MSEDWKMGELASEKPLEKSVPKEQIQIFRKHILKHTYIIPPKSNFRCSNYSLDMVPEMGVAPKSPILSKFSITNHPRVPPF